MRRFSVCSILLLTMSLLLAACGAASPGPMTWLDRPLDGAALPLAPVTIQAHASDDDGVASFQFLVNDDPLVTASADGGRLGTAMVEWNPTAPGTYTIRARGIDSQGNAGSEAVSVVTVGQSAAPSSTPSPAPEAPAQVQISFTADRTNLMRGECAVLMWRVERGEAAVLNGEEVPLSGDREVCPPETMRYVLAVYVGVGPPSAPAAERELIIVVGEPEATSIPPTPAAPTATVAPPAATSTPLPAPPTIVSFQANPASITEGQCTTLIWAVERALTGVWLDGEGVFDHDSDDRCPTVTTTYTLVARSPGGEDTRSITVQVTPAVSSADLAITDLRAVPPSHEVHGDITNHGPGTVRNVTVQLYCEWEEIDPIEGVPADSGNLGPIPIAINRLNPGQTQEFNTDITVRPGPYNVNFSCTIQVPFNDPNPSNNTHSEEGW